MRIAFLGVKDGAPGVGNSGVFRITEAVGGKTEAPSPHRPGWAFGLYSESEGPHIFQHSLCCDSDYRGPLSSSELDSSIRGGGDRILGVGC